MFEINHYSFSSAGGAGQVARQLNVLQINEGLDSRLITTTEGDIRSVIGSHPILFSKALVDYYLIRNSLTNPLFSLFRNGVSIDSAKMSTRVDSINHLHWIPGTVELGPSFQRAPLVWTLHDMWPFTGGCHHSLKCEAFTDGCGHCPQVRGLFRKRVAAMRTNKFEYLRSAETFAAVAPSNWMTRTAQQSSILKDKRIETIYNPVEDVFFQSHNRKTCRERLKIPQDSFVIGTSAANLRDPLKGISKLLELLHRLADRYLEKQFVLLCIGAGKVIDSTGSLRIIHTGFISDRSEVAAAMGTLDIFVSASIAESAGLAVAEALAGGVPIACTNTGGMSECIDSGRNGIFIENSRNFENFVIALYTNKNLRHTYSENAREFAKLRYLSATVHKRYFDLYQDLITRAE